MNTIDNSFNWYDCFLLFPLLSEKCNHPNRLVPNLSRKKKILETSNRYYRFVLKGQALLGDGREKASIDKTLSPWNRSIIFLPTTC